MEHIEKSLQMLKDGERLALALNPDDGYYLAFSGGKDSQVVYELCRMAGVRFRAYYSVTGNEIPKNVYFVRENYPEVVLSHPKEKFLKLVEKKGLPTINRRYCCERLKEKMGAGNAVLTGVRWEESRKRAEYYWVEIYSRRVEHRGKPWARSIEQIMENEHQCIKGQDRVMIRPILHWTEEQVWEFIRDRKLPVNPCYRDVGRVGCMFCPFSSKWQMTMYELDYPGFRRALLKALEKYWSRTNEHLLESPEQYYQWWKSKKTVKQFLKNK